jgi:cell division protein FtsQ
MKMISDYSYADSVNHGAGAKSSKKIEKGLKRLLVIAAVIFIAEIIWLFGVSPFIPFSNIEVHEFDGFERAQVLTQAGIDETSSYMSTNVRDVRERLAANVLVESAVVIKRFPDKLSIFLVPRTAAAVTLATAGTRQVPMCVDRHGVFFKIAEGGFYETQNLPVLSGIENPMINMRLPSGLIALLDSICVISSSSPELLSAISEIRIERKAWDGYDLVLFPVHSSIKVRLENNLTEDVLKFMFLMLNVFESASPAPDEIDFRSGIGSYKIEEQS